MDRILEFSANHTLLVFALVTSFLLVVFSEIRRKTSGIFTVEPTEAVRLINNDAAVIDLRSQEAYSRGHIVNARNIPADDLDARIDKLEPLRDKPLVVVCDAGMSSTKAVASLRKAGFESAWGLKRGMAGWTEAGLPVVSGRKKKKK